MKKDVHPLQGDLAETLKAEKAIQSKKVEAAFLAVPRHLFLKHLSPESAYQNENIPTKRSHGGEVISSASHPGVVAGILERLELSPGQRVLEIGAGTGFNAALPARLVQQVSSGLIRHQLFQGRPTRTFWDDACVIHHQSLRKPL